MKRDVLRKLTKKLQELNLTEYQSKALTALTALGESKAQEIIELTDIPQARIYQILDELLEMGALRKKPGRPMKYTALRPSEALSNIIKKTANRPHISGDNICGRDIGDRNKKSM